jgi:hypothetical protein
MTSICTRYHRSPALRRSETDARRLRVAFPGDQGGHHVPAGDPEDVRGHHGEFDAGVLQQLLHPVLLRGGTLTRSMRYRVRSHSRRMSRGGTKLGADHQPFGDLAQPDGVQLVGLRATGQMLDVFGVDQPGIETGDVTPTVAVKPSWVDDVTQYMHSMDEFMEENLAKTEPRALLIVTRLHRCWYRSKSTVSRRSRKIGNSLALARNKVATLVPRSHR